MSLAPGTTLGPYEVVARIGAGGMGEVFRARDSRLHREVAVKILPAQVADDPDRRARFERESRAVAALSHPNILAIFDVGVAGTVTYAVTELLDGESLRERLANGPLPVRKAIDIAAQIARGLSAAHDKGIVHRDLKPENIVILHDGRVKILDFGLARTVTDSTTVTTTGTDPGMVMGTVGYMAPEQVRAQPADARTDLFALGLVLHEMLSGQRAFWGDTPAETMTALLREDPPELLGTRSDISPALDRIVKHCLEKNPTERFQTARDVAFALEALSGSAATGGSAAATGAPPGRHGRWLWPVVAALATFVVMSSVLVWDRAHRAVPRPRYIMKTFTPETMFSANFMPDGTSFAYSSMGDSLSQIFLVRPDRSVPEPIGEPGMLLLAISRAGELAVLVDIDPAAATGTLARLTIGGAPRKVHEHVRWADWSPDGNAFAIAQAVDGRYRIEYPIGTPLYETFGFITMLKVSPDGERVAFGEIPPGGDARPLIKVVDRSRRTVNLPGEFPSQYGLAWSPDGAKVVFSAATGDPGQPSWVRHVHVVAASGRAPAELLLDTPGAFNVNDVNARGDLLAARSDVSSGIMVHLPGAPADRNLSWMSDSLWPLLSRDGSLVAFQRTVAIPQTGGSPGFDILLRKTDGSPPFRVGQGNMLGLSPDGSKVLAITANDLVVYPTGPGDRTVLRRGPIETYLALGDWFPDGERVLICGNESGHGPRCYEQRPDGLPKAVTPEGLISAHGPYLRVALSPNGRYLLSLDPKGTWQVVDLSNGTSRVAAGLKPTDLLVGWSQDGTAAFVARPGGLGRVNLQTGASVLVREVAPADRVGVTRTVPTSIIDDGRGYAYYYVRDVSTWYVVQNLGLGR